MEKEVEKKFLVEYKHQQKKEFEVSLPMPRVIFLDLFDFLDQKLESLTCYDAFLLKKLCLKVFWINPLVNQVEVTLRNYLKKSKTI